MTAHPLPNKAGHHAKEQRPPRSQIAIAKLIVKRDLEGKGNFEVTEEMRRVASFDL